MAFKSFAFLLLPFLLISTGSANERNENQEPKNSNNHKIYRLSLKPQVSNLIDKSIHFDQSTYENANFDINKSNDLNLRSKQLDLKRPIIKHDELVKRESESNETYNELAVNSKQMDNVDDNQYDSDVNLIISNNNQTTLSANLGLKKETEISSNNLKDMQSNNKSDDKTSNLGNDILKDDNLSEAHLDANLKKDKDEKSKDSLKYETATALDNYSIFRRDRSSDEDDEDDDDDDESDEDENNEDKNELENDGKKTKENEVSNDLEGDSNEEKLKKILKKLIDKEEKKSKDKVISLINSIESEKNKIKKVLEQYKKELLIHKMKSEKEENDQDKSNKSNSTDAVSFISTKESIDTAIANQSIAIANLNQERTTESSTDSQSNNELSSAYEVDNEPIFATTVSSLPNAKEESMNKVTDVKFNYNSNTESPVTTASKDLIIDDIEIQPNTIIPKIYVHSNMITYDNEERTTLRSDEIY